MARLARQGVLLTYLINPDGTPANPPACATTSHIESINAVVRELFHVHRGASAYHQAVIAEWALLLRTPQPPIPTEVLTQREHDGRPTPRRILTPKHPNHTDQKCHGILEGTPTPEEGLWPRKGWAGRAHQTHNTPPKAPRLYLQPTDTLYHRPIMALTIGQYVQ